MKKTYEKTDWDIYYSNPKSWFSNQTQKITIKLLGKIIRENISQPLRIVECGGGNSCFAKDFRKMLNVKEYDIIDNCETALAKTDMNQYVDNAYKIDLTDSSGVKDDTKEKYNLVYSVGLVEHFSDNDRAIVIKQHFDLCEKNGFVLITAPTPTLKYRFIRRMMEIFGLWQFWDEKPIEKRILENELKEYGTIVFSDINKKLPLSQVVVLVKK